MKISKEQERYLSHTNKASINEAKVNSQWILNIYVQHVEDVYVFTRTKRFM
ncbi:hypothetical protein BD780_001715 [Clostridium tetanomorphum]|uniref:Uncharacterized protein n=1 Tax=Clostridium tetanomorphum TaxID=1553 RepID=A0A923EBE8_CLOTT|nr:hypothetical protein [Clostridium tetanomorphum]MBC2398644.1 hypothetical protein [Clostridium tetanomorphum]MBP1864077.1 hypothetical protein [Clostridium tetanomorphum]NRS84490.1 hypothetical protein [Clostridium tetanomorphum]NRZ97704.1 hypothetical protein [Clostridium tetanomorphum]